MGMGARAAVSILENTLQILFAVLQISVLAILKTLKKSPRAQVPPTIHPELFQSATSLAGRIRRREITSQRVVEIFISRVKEINPVLNFLVQERFNEAVEDAKCVDKYLNSTQQSEDEIKADKPFLGVPYTVKESLAVKGMRHTAGVISRKDIIAEEDCPAVRLMRAAGAIPIAVTNTPEMCCWWETYNPLHGRTNNPYDTRRSAGGSSGGEGAVIAAAGSLFGIGSDFAGSIRVPAAFNGIFGHRPTSLTCSNEGHYPIPANINLKPMLTSGPLSRYASDLRPILKIISQELAPDLDLSSPVDFKNLTIFFMEDCDMFLTSAVQTEIKESIRKTVEHFRSLGAKTEKLRLKGMRYAMMYWYAKIKTNDGPQLGKELANREGSVSVTGELFKKMVGASQHTLPVILFGVLESANGIPYKGALHTAVLDEFEEFQQEIKDKLGENCVLILPAHPTTAQKHGEAMARSMDLGYAAVFNVLGYPSTCCPVSRDQHGMPVGVQVVANAFQDRLTLATAEEIERAFGGWTPPFTQS